VDATAATSSAFLAAVAFAFVFLLLTGIVLLFWIKARCQSAELVYGQMWIFWVEGSPECDWF
jgi:hypothetical protein